MTHSPANQYDPRNIETLEMVYGDGYLSMGGDDEVASIVSLVAVEGKDVLDVGCGLGGAAITLVRDHAARHVHGIDIDASVLIRANALVEQADLQAQITLTQFEPGPLPLADNSFDLVFVTAVSCHIEDLTPFFTEIQRVIRPGGCMLGGEWFKQCDNEAFQQWDDLLRERGLNFYFVTSETFENVLADCGFEQITVVNRNSEMTALTQTYLERSETDLKQRLIEAMGDQGYAAFLQWTRIRANGFAQGGSAYGHFVAHNATL